MMLYQRNVVPLYLGAGGPRKTRYSLTLRRGQSSKTALWKFHILEDLDPPQQHYGNSKSQKTWILCSSVM